MKTVTLNVEVYTEDGIKTVGDLNKEISKTITTIDELESTAEALRNELKGLDIGSEEFKKIQNELVKVDSALKDTNKSIEGLDFEAKAGELGKLAGGVGAVGTAVALTFGENETVEQFFQTFAKGIAITQGVKGAIEAFAAAQKLLNGITLAGTLLQAKTIAQNIAIAASTAAAAVASGAQTVATTAATAAQWALNAAMTANPIGLIITGIAALVAGIILLVKNIDSVVDWFIELGKQMLNLLNPLGALISMYQLFFGEVEEGEKSVQETRKESWEEYQKQHKAAQELRKEEIKTLRDNIKEIQHKKEIQKEQNDLRLLQAEAEGGSERELFELQKQINAENLEMTIKEIEADNLLIAKQHEIAQAEYDRFLQFLETEAIRNGMTQKEIDDLKVRLEEKKEQYLKDEKERIEANERAIETLKAQNTIFAKSFSENSEEMSEAEKKRFEELNKFKEDKQKEFIEFENKLLSDSSLDKEMREQLLAEKLIQISRETGQKIIDLDFEDNSVLAKAQNEFLKLTEKNQTEHLDKRNDTKKQKDLESSEATLAISKETNGELSKEEQERLEKQKFIAEQSIALAQEAQAVITEILQRGSEKRLAAIQSEYDSESKSLKSALDNREISQKEYDARLAVLEEKRRQKEKQEARKAFKNQKALALSDIAIKLASQIAGIQANAAANPANAVTFGTAGISQASILTGLAIATSSAQAALVASQKFRAARGGVVPGQPSSVDSVDALLAPGEMVINSNSAQMFPQTLSAINQAGGGISLAPETSVTSVNSTTVFEQNKPPQVVEAVMVYSKFDESYKQGNRLRNAASFSNR